MPFAFIDKSLEETPSVEVLDFSSTEAIREAGESSNHMKASLLDVTELLGISMASRNYFDSSKAFTDFDELISAKLDLSEVRSTRKDRSFVFGFRQMVKVRTLVFYPLFLIIISMSNICSFL